MPFTREQAQQVDRRAIAEYGIPGLVLMENAGRGTADVLCRLGIDGRVVVCCGKGNNAGDGFVIARHLDLRGFRAEVLLWADPAELMGDAAVNFQILRRAGLPIEVFFPQHDPARLQRFLNGADWVVDALLGTGARGEPRPPLDAVIEAVNAATARRLAVDLPSGLDCNTGHAAAHTVRADHTCTFVAPKAGFLEASAKPYLGTVHVLDIGAPRRLVEEVLQSGG